jgi:hypothetical protein
MKYLALLLPAVCAGCGVAGDSDNHGFGFRVDEVGESGLWFQYRPGKYDPALGYMPYLEETFASVQECTGLSAHPPFVVVVTHSEMPTSSGYTYYDPPLVTIRTNLLVLRHEYVHYLLSQTGFDDGANSNHQSPLFALCGTEKLFIANPGV